MAPYAAVKLQKRYAYTAKGKDYHKYLVTLPPDQVEGLGWAHGADLEAVPRKGGLLLRPKEHEPKSEDHGGDTSP